jgi:hypothetical protein
MEQPDAAKECRHHAFQDHVNAVAQVEHCHHDAVQEGERVDDHEIVSALGQDQDARDGFVVDLCRLDGVGGGGQQRVAVNHKSIQPITLAHNNFASATSILEKKSCPIANRKPPS